MWEEFVTSDHIRTADCCGYKIFYCALLNPSVFFLYKNTVTNSAIISIDYLFSKIYNFHVNCIYNYICKIKGCLHNYAEIYSSLEKQLSVHGHLY